MIILSERFTIEIIKWGSSNGEIQQKDIQQLLVKNRAFWLGENFFTSFRTLHGSPLFLEDHLNRLVGSLKYFYDGAIHPEGLEQLIGSLINVLNDTCKISQNKFSESQFESYIRLTIIPEMRKFAIDDGLEFYFQIYLNELPATKKVKNCCFKQRSLGVMPFGKVGDYNHQSRDLMLANRKGFDEVIYHSPTGSLLEATTSNLIVVDLKEKLVVRPRSELIFEGITSEKLVPIFHDMGYQIVNTNINYQAIDKTKHLLLTNSVSLVTCGIVNGSPPVDHDFVSEINRLLLRKEIEK